MVVLLLNDTTNRKLLALQLLALGRSIREICAELGIKRHKIRQWKDVDATFRRKWNGTMAETGRWIENEEDEA